MSAGEKTSPLQTIPLEVRWMIWDEVGEVEDFCSLIQTCKWIGAEILERIPVPGCKCKSRLHNHCPRPIIKLDHLAIIVDPYCSPGRSWLKFEATPPGSANRRRPPVVWTIRDLDSALTPDLACIQSRRITIEFRAPKRGYYFVFFLVLRAKLFDVCQIINRMDGSPLPAEQGRWQQQREEKRKRKGSSRRSNSTNNHWRFGSATPGSRRTIHFPLLLHHLQLAAAPTRLSGKIGRALFNALDGGGYTATVNFAGRRGRLRENVINSHTFTSAS